MKKLGFGAMRLPVFDRDDPKTIDLEQVKQMAESILHFDEIYCQKASPAVAVNCGPGTFGLLFRSLEKRLEY